MLRQLLCTVQVATKFESLELVAVDITLLRRILDCLLYIGHLLVQIMIHCLCRTYHSLVNALKFFFRKTLRWLYAVIKIFRKITWSSSYNVLTNVNSYSIIFLHFYYKP